MSERMDGYDRVTQKRSLDLPGVESENARLKAENERLLALAAHVMGAEERCTNHRRFPNGCGECSYCLAAAALRS